MKFTSRTQRSFMFSAITAILLAWTATASATTVLLTGGDGGDGLTLNSSHVVLANAVNQSNNALPQTVQGVTFNSSGAGVSLSLNNLVFPPHTGFTGDTFAGPLSTNDVALLAVDNAGVGYQPNSGSPPTAIFGTVSGLTPNAFYTVDSLLSVQGYGNMGNPVPRNETITYNNNPSITDTVGILNGQLWDAHHVVQASGSGTIALSYVGIAVGLIPNDGGVVQAVIVTAAPEPASFILCGLGAIGLFVAARRRLKV